VLERASARETVARVAVGAVCKELLAHFGIRVTSHVVVIGGVEADTDELSFDRILKLAELSPVRCADPRASRKMMNQIDRAVEESDTLGGVFEVVVNGAPAGLGSHVQWDRRLSARLAQAVMSVQAVRGVSFGIGFEEAYLRGSIAHDEIFYSRGRGYFRKTNRAGGIEGGMSNGEDIVLRAAMKPISTLRQPLASVNIRSKKPVRATVERSDACAVPAAGVVGEAATAFEIANAMIEKFGGDSVAEMKRNFEGYIRQVKNS
jgi:chorismate synthase